MGDSLPIVALGTGRTAVSIAAGANHTCALLDDGTVKCWGQNDNGQLGIGSTDTKGDSVSEMGNALPIVQLGTGRTAKRIYAGGNNTCATLDNDTTKCWGANVWFAQLGDGTKVNKGTSPTQMGNALAPLKLGGSLTITHMEIGGGHMCAVLNSNGIKCWGANSNEQLGSIYNWTLGIDEDLPYVDLGTTIETVPTMTKTKSPTRTPTRSKTLTRSKTPTRTRTMTRSMTPSKTRTATRTSTATKTPSPTP
jgi:alpha-tubulin suppressor-like RCC1 family protein